MTPHKHIFYHICCNGNTLAVVKDQVTKIVYSGLYNVITSVHCFLVGDPNSIVNVVEYLNTCGYKFKICDVCSDDATYERFTLLQIRKYVHPHDYILYIHTKGITKAGEEAKCCEDWRHFMEFHLIFHHKDCIGKLEEEYQTVGVNLQMDPAPHYSGNFWWCRAAYFLNLNTKNLERVYYGSTYHAPEMFLLSGMESLTNAYEITKSREIQNHYLERYPWTLYIDDPSIQK